MDKSSLASQVYEIQEKLNLPGLVRECKEIIEDLNLPNIFEVKMSKYQWKEKVKCALKSKNEKDIKSKMEESKKLKNSELMKEKCEIKEYVKDLNLHDARIIFKHRTSMSQYVKFNFKNDKLYSKALWKCECGEIDSENHLIWCKLYKNERNGLDINNNDDLSKYLDKVLKIRMKKEKPDEEARNP